MSPTLSHSTDPRAAIAGPEGAEATLAAVAAFARAELAPQADRLDRDPAALGAALAALGDRGWLALRLPPALGGAGFDGPTYGRFCEILARHSGALAFLQTQHQGAAASLASGADPAIAAMLAAGLGADLAWGRRRVGSSFSHLRRPGEPVLRALPDGDGGYRLWGRVPWATGAGCFPELLLAAQLPDGGAIFGWVPLGDADAPDGGRLRCLPLELAAMGSTGTVAIAVENWPLGADGAVLRKPPGWLAAADRQKVLNHAYFALGCARAGLDALAAAGDRRPSPTLHQTWKRLDAALNRCRAAILAARPADPFADRLALRVRAIALALDCARAAVVASGGAALGDRHPAQRVYREAMTFAVAGQTAAVAEATLAELGNRAEGDYGSAAPVADPAIGDRPSDGAVEGDALL